MAARAPWRWWRVLARPTRFARLVSQKAVDAFLGEALLPTPHRGSAHVGLTRDLDDGPSFRRKHNDPGSLNVLLRTIAVIEDRGKRGPVVGPDEDIDGLCHPTRIAWTGTSCEASV